MLTLRLKADLNAIRQNPERIRQSLDKITYRVALTAANMMKQGVAKATSTTANSITVEKKGEAHYHAGPHVASAYWLEHGRNPGKQPPKDAILDWMKVKGIRLPEKEAKQVAFLIARKIGQQGTKAQPFVSPVAKDKILRDEFRRLVKAEFA